MKMAASYCISPLLLLRSLMLFVFCFNQCEAVRKVTVDIPSDDVMSSSLSLPIEHSFSEGPNPSYTLRGYLKFRSLKQGAGIFEQTNPLSTEEIIRLKELADSGGIYRVRVPTQLLSLATSENIGFVSSYTKACAILESNMSDEITVHADQSGQVLGVSIRPLKGSCVLGGTSVPSSDFEDFNTTVTLSLVVPGPVPDTQSYLEKLEEEKQQKKASATDNRSFFAKYWMYIVPVVLFLMISGGSEPQRGGGS